MLPLDLFFTVAFIATVHIILGLFLGDFLGRRREPNDRKDLSLNAARMSQFAVLYDELSTQLASLHALKQLTHAPSAHELQQAVESFRSILKETILAVVKSQQLLPSDSACRSKDSSEEKAPHTDRAQIKDEKWFPTGLAETRYGRRASERFKYDRMQLIAPVVGPDLPRPEDFFEVPFHDLAADGFSFFAHNKLDCKELVAQLGAAPETVAVLARVVHQRTHQHFGRPEILVGCQILRRIQVQRLEQSESNADGAAPIQLEFALSP